MSKAINQLIEARLEDINLSDEFVGYTNAINQDFEQLLDPFTQSLDAKKKMELMDNLRAIVFDQVLFQSKLTYKTAFMDGMSFTLSNFVMENKK
ncbi:hypothetical protein QMK38_01150 [Lysinibacillus fusiformis]|nr:hypothetical protein [Lysinibacillus fusiformis]